MEGKQKKISTAERLEIYSRSAMRMRDKFFKKMIM